jgi:hypothetical protein
MLNGYVWRQEPMGMPLLGVKLRMVLVVQRSEMWVWQGVREEWANGGVMGREERDTDGGGGG